MDLIRRPQKHLDGRARGDKPGADRPRRLKPGTVLLREYQGERHTVTVVPNGYLWRETTYASLSTIARAITGTAWSGPLLFLMRGITSNDFPAPLAACNFPARRKLEKYEPKHHARLRRAATRQ